MFEAALPVETGPLALALPERQYACPMEPVAVYDHANTPELPGARDEMPEGDGPEASVSTAPPAHGVREEGAMSMRAVEPLLATSISTWKLWPLMMLSGERAKDAVKLPMTTVLELADELLALPALFVALAVK